MPRHSQFPVGAWVDGLATRRYQVSEQTLYRQVLAVLFYRRRTESLRERPALAGNGGAFKIWTRHSCLRSACHARAR